MIKIRSLIEIAILWIICSAGTVIFLFYLFDIFYYTIFFLFFSSFIFKPMRHLFSQKDKYAFKIMEIVLLIVFMGAISIVFSIHSKIHDTDDPTYQRADPLMWARPENIFANPIEQINHKYSPPVSRITFEKDTTPIINAILIDATKYNFDKDVNIMNYSNLNEYLRSVINISTTQNDENRGLRSTLGKFIICNSLDNILYNNKKIQTSIFYYFGGNNLHKLDKTLLFNSEELQKLISDNYDNLLQDIYKSGRKISNPKTNFCSLLGLLNRKFLTLKRINIPTQKINLIIISDFIDESPATEIQNFTDTIKQVFRQENINKVVLLKTTSINGSNMPRNSRDVFSYLLSNIGQDKESCAIDLSDPDFNKVKFNLATCLYPVQFNSYETIKFYYPYDDLKTNKMRKANILICDKSQSQKNWCSYECLGKIEDFPTSILTIKNKKEELLSEIKLNSAFSWNPNDSQYIMTLDEKHAPEDKNKPSIKIASVKECVIKKSDIELVENNSYSNPTLQNILYSLANTSYIFLLLSPFIYLSANLYKNRKLTKKQYERTICSLSTLIITAITYYFLYVYYKLHIITFAYFWLPAGVSFFLLLIAGIILYKEVKNIIDG